jgi:hypothetical protein
MAVLFGLTVLTASPAMPHTLSYPRLVHVRFGPELVEVAVQVTVHAGAKARALRDRHDLDKDGALSEEEKQALAQTLDAQGRARLRVIVDGVPLSPEVGVLDLEVTDEPNEGQTLAVKSVAAVSVVLLPGVHDIAIEDMPPSPRATVPLRVESRSFKIERGTSDKDAMPLTPLAPGSWLGGFAGDGGTVYFTLEVPPR